MLYCAPRWLRPAKDSTVKTLLCCPHFTTCATRVTARPSLPNGLWKHSLAQPSFKHFPRLRHALLQPAASISSSAKAAAAADASPAPLALPDYCAGCGVKLQEEDADRPGWDDTMLHEAKSIQVVFQEEECAA